MKKLLYKLGQIIFVIFAPINNLFGRCHRALLTGYYTARMKNTDSSVAIYGPIDRIIGREFISMGKFSSIGKRATITAYKIDKDPAIIIGNNTAIGDDCHITAINMVHIGNNVLIAKKVTITDNAHGENKSRDDMSIHPSKRHTYSKGPVIIDDSVWVGDKVTICPNVHIGCGAVIGANSVVTHDVPAYSIVAGAPAELIRNIE